MNKRAAAVGLISAALPRRLRGMTPHPGAGQNPLKMKHLPGESPPVPLPPALGAPGSTLSSRPHTKGANGDQERPRLVPGHSISGDAVWFMWIYAFRLCTANGFHAYGHFCKIIPCSGWEAGSCTTPLPYLHN